MATTRVKSRWSPWWRGENTLRLRPSAIFRRFLYRADRINQVTRNQRVERDQQPPKRTAHARHQCRSSVSGRSGTTREPAAGDFRHHAFAARRGCAAEWRRGGANDSRNRVQRARCSGAVVHQCDRTASDGGFGSGGSGHGSRSAPCAGGVAGTTRSSAHHTDIPAVSPCWHRVDCRVASRTLVFPPLASMPIVDAHVHIFPYEIVQHRERFFEREDWFQQLYSSQRSQARYGGRTDREHGCLRYRDLDCLRFSLA